MSTRARYARILIRKRRAENGAPPMAKGEHTVILHCMRKATWEERKHRECWGRRNIAADGFIHCSTVEYFWRVAPNFRDVREDMVLVCIDENRLKGRSDTRTWTTAGENTRMYTAVSIMTRW